DSRFDAAMLDIQMPDMDGIELLRRLPGLPGCGDLPAIALTAGVQRDDRNVAEAAGMTDFLPKPLEPRRLIRSLRRHVQVRRGAAVPVQPRPTPAAPGQALPPLDIDGIEDDAIAPSLRRDRPLVLSMIRRLLAEFGALGAEPAQTLPARLHKLRGSAGVVGARELADAAQQLERALQAGDEVVQGTALTRLVGLLDAMARAARPALQAEDERLASAQHALLAREEPPLSRAELDALMHQIELQDVRAVAQVEALAPRLLPMIGPDGLARLRSALEEFDFSAAGRLLQSAGRGG
ncbi:MAG: hypothetical protein RLZZ598_528, partial [Pseudomonadota bacterium]